MVVDEIHKTVIHSSTSNTSQKRGRHGRDHMVVLQLSMQSVPITTND
jgi:hypothetical protein